jgi:putative membrane protein
MIALLVDYEARWRMHDDNGAGWAMVLVMLVFLAALAVVVYVFVRGSSSTTAGSAAATSAVNARTILQERFARGEIDEDEYRSRMRALDETG